MTSGQRTVESGDTAPPGTQEKPLRESLEDASVLLWFATREGKQVSKETIGDIVEAQSSLVPGTRNPPLESRFWVALRELAAAVQPASVDSILATYSYPFGDHGKSGKRRLVDATSTKKKYSGASIAVLVSLLIVQIYWFIGTAWRTDLEANRTELDRIAGSLREMELKVKAAQYLVVTKEQKLTIAPESATAIVNATQTAEDARAIIEEQLEVLKEEQDRTGLEYENVTLRGERVRLMLDGNFLMLGWWDFVSDLVGTSPATETADIAPKNGSRGEASLALETNGASSDSMFRQELAAKKEVLVQEQLAVEVALLNSKSVLAILSQYVLPLLYGLLGSLAYILRTLSTEIQSVTFTRGSEIRYSLRWPLGMLGGVTVGLFFDPAKFSGLAMITPLGLAFLAGYGVELLFTGLDRIVRAFTSEETARPKVA